MFSPKIYEILVMLNGHLENYRLFVGVFVQTNFLVSKESIYCLVSY